MEDQTLAAGEFKATCLKLMDQVAETGRSVVITKRGKPVAKLVPADKPKAKLKPLFGALKHSIQIIGDLEAPLHTKKELERLNSWPVRRWDRINRRVVRQSRNTKGRI